MGSVVEQSGKNDFICSPSTSRATQQICTSLHSYTSLPDALRTSQHSWGKIDYPSSITQGTTSRRLHPQANAGFSLSGLLVPTTNLISFFPYVVPAFFSFVYSLPSRQRKHFFALCMNLETGGSHLLAREPAISVSHAKSRVGLLRIGSLCDSQDH